MLLNTLFAGIYALALAGLYGFTGYLLALLLLFLARQKRPSQMPPPPTTWPTVTVQLPIYNEQATIGRLIRSIVALDYDPRLLSIQVLDDSSDETCEVVHELVSAYQSQGVNIVQITRLQRAGYKAGALENGLKTATGKYIAVFDADFLPHRDFLKRLIPYLEANAKQGMVQARWGHINADYNTITRGQALLLDGNFVVVETACSRWDLAFCFNGSAGIWRRQTIEDSGGWQGDTLAEDMDLSYRALQRGWQLTYVPDVVAPAEIPPQVLAFKQQQYRWACGSTQVLLKTGRHLWRSKLPLSKRISGYLNMVAYLSHPLMMLLFLSCFPIVIRHITELPSFGWLSLSSFAPPLFLAISQQAAYPDWKRRFLYFPVLMALSVGLAFNNTVAILAGLSGRRIRFERTPKFHLENRSDTWAGNRYQLPIHWTVWAELILFLSSATLLYFSTIRTPLLAPTLLLYTAGFGFTGLSGLWEGIHAH